MGNFHLAEATSEFEIVRNIFDLLQQILILFKLAIPGETHHRNLDLLLNFLFFILPPWLPLAQSFSLIYFFHFLFCIARSSCHGLHNCEWAHKATSRGLVAKQSSAICNR